jgi:putative transposase
MARPLRIEFAGALYHVTSRGDGREPIYAVDQNRQVWLEVLGSASASIGSSMPIARWATTTTCWWKTPDGNLAKGMRQLNGIYTQRFNQAHLRVGHVFQGR